MSEPVPYNPLAKRHLAASVVSRLLLQQPAKLPADEFVGAGVYLIYYTGDFAAYRKISDSNMGGRFQQPIYVGKAIPAGGRKGGKGLDTPHGKSLHKRLAEHAASLDAARNLRREDFWCRWLVVDEVFIPLGETLLISHYKPLWNLVVDGFGNHPPGKGRKQGRKPMWDILHPGRAWAGNLGAAMTEEQVLEKIRTHLASTPVPPQQVF